MHRIPKMFSNSSNRRKTSGDSGSRSGGSSSSGKQKPRPRLDRLNAVKNINYEFSPYSTSDSPSSSHYSSEESLRTRSLDYDGRSSFRVDGVDGDIEILCKSLGFSGIDDFEIPAEEYEAMKVRSSSAPVMFSQAIKPLLDRQIEVNYDEDAQFSDEISREIMENDKYVGFSGNSSDVIRNKCEESRSNVFGSRLEDYDRSRVNEIRGNGIKGTRPPVLAPPPLMTLPVIDKECSTWDMFRSFAPDSETNNSRFELGFCLDKDEEGPEEGGWERNGNGSYSFTTTSNDDDSSSSTTEAMSSISPSGRFRCVITDWQKGELLGRGSFGSVYEGIADGGFFFAVKEVSLLDKGDEGKQRIIQLEQEIALLSQFEHENIVRYYGAKKDESNLYIFLELVTKGSLLSLYQKYTLRDSVVSAYTRQILHGLKYLHDRNVVHRDIKCANILVDTNGLVKLADFGLAKATKLNDVKSCKGTAFWMAPEVVRSLGYGLAADIWSLGCTVLEMLTRRFPYSDFECMAALFRIGKGERPTIPNSLSSDAQDFILKCLQVDPSLRPSAAQLLDHPFVKRPLPPSSPHYFARKI